MGTIRIVILVLSALLLLFVGSMRLGNPIKTYLKNSGIKLNQDVDLLNEIRGVSAVMLSGGIVCALGAFIPQLTLASFLVATVIFVGFAIGRLISMSADGKPNRQLIQGLIFELVLGAANVFGLLSILDF